MKNLILLCLCGLAANVYAAEFKYTSVADADCVMVDSSTLDKTPEVDYSNYECPSLGGYRVNVAGGDLRYDLQLNYEGKSLVTANPESFHSPGAAKIEWRYTRSGSIAIGRTVNYHALIYRVAYTKPSFEKSTSALVVMRLNGPSSCVIGIVGKRKGVNENTEARKIADDMSKPCISTNWAL